MPVYGMTSQPLRGKMAVVAGATRGAGRGIAIELAAAGAKVYCAGRSVVGRLATPGRPETIDETAALIRRDGGQAVPVRVDFQNEADVVALASRLRADEGGLDILVNDIWGGEELIDWGASFWTLDLGLARRLLDQAVLTHLTAARHLAPIMLDAGKGLIVEVTDGAELGYRGHLLYDLIKSSVNRLAYGMAWDFAGKGVTALAVSPGFLRSEAALERHGVTEETWREINEDDLSVDQAGFQFSESPRYIGRAVAALASDPAINARSGAAFFVGDLAEEYGFTDVDGTRPHFWRGLERWLAPSLAETGRLPRKVWLRAVGRYQNIHLTPELGAQASRYAARLGLNSLGAGLRPIRSP
jgi:NAD(P)-dependent dehydrogenase (short-subunit alcohol dehydrogenase family)